MSEKKKGRRSLTSFSILILILIVLALISHLVPSVTDVDGNVIAVTGASLADVLMAPVLGFADAKDVCIFVLVLGGFLGVVTKTGALDTGIAVLVRKLHGNELILIPILMTIFSIGGSTYGMLEETVPFYLLLAATMVAAGFDSVVGAAVVLLGAGSGVLGSTVNPFAVGAAIDSVADMSINNGTIIAIGAVLWITTLLISIFFVMQYAKKVKADKGSTILSLQEQEAMKENFVDKEVKNDAVLSGSQKAVLVLFAFTFVVMIIGFIPWESFNINIFLGWSEFLTGLPLGQWYFQEATTWFLLMAIIIGIVGRMSEGELVNTFIAGTADMMSVVLIIALARGASVLMSSTGLDAWILTSAANALRGMSAGIFAPLAYLIYIPLSFLVPSSSGLATLSVPVMAPLAGTLGFSVETMIMIFVAGNGLVNLFTPTCGAIMGGLAIARIEYSTWLKFATKIIVTIAIVNIIILTACMLIL